MARSLLLILACSLFLAGCAALSALPGIAWTIWGFAAAFLLAGCIDTELPEFDTGDYEFSIASVTVDEGDTATFTITRTDSSGVDVTVDFSLSGYSEYGDAAVVGTYCEDESTDVLDFAYGEDSYVFDSDTSAVYANLPTCVNYAGSYVYESAYEEFRLTAEWSETDSYGYSGYDSTSATATIVDSTYGGEGLSINDVTGDEGDTFTFTITRTGDLSGSASVNVQTDDDSATGGASCTFAGYADFVEGYAYAYFGAYDDTAYVYVTVCGNSDYGEETFYLTLYNEVGANIVDGTGIGTIVDVY